jgi:hypothetical protein
MLNVVLKLLMLLPFAAIAQPKDVSGWRDIKWGMTVSQAIQSLGAGCAAAPRVRIASPNAPFFGARSHNTYEEPAAWVRQCKIAQAPYPSYDGEVEHATVSRITLAGYTGAVSIRTKRESDFISSIVFRPDSFTDETFLKLISGLSSEYGASENKRTNGDAVVWRFPSTKIELTSAVPPNPNPNFTVYSVRFSPSGRQ